MEEMDVETDTGDEGFNQLRAREKAEIVMFVVIYVLFQAFILTIYAIWFGYVDDLEAKEEYLVYGLIRDVNIMVFFGFAYLMTFLRRYAYMAIGMTFFISCLVCQWSFILQAFFESLDDEGENLHHFHERFPVGLMNMVNALFCAASVMISYGGVLGKVTPLQMLIMAIIEPIFFWINFYICELVLHVFDIGGGFYIHIYGAYFGLTVAFFVTTKDTLKHFNNRASYDSDVFAYAGTIFLFLLWPSFNAVLAPDGVQRVRALLNTFTSLLGATCATFTVSRVVSGGKFENAHLQNAALAGGVVMGIAAHLNLYPATALGCGLLAGTVSTLGFRFVTPFMARYLHIHDTCGIHNLHGVPGLMGALVSIFACLAITQRDNENALQPEFYHGTWQPAFQFAAMGIVFGNGILGGLITGLIFYALGLIRGFKRSELFADAPFFYVPSDYDTLAKSD